MAERKRDLNDSFFVAPSLQEHERKDYVPGDVDREKVYATWDRIFQEKGQRIPQYVDGLLDLSEKYMDKSLEVLASGLVMKAYGFSYFAVLLSLKAGMVMEHVEHEKAQRLRARCMERMFSEEQLLPKLLTSKTAN